MEDSNRESVGKEIDFHEETESGWTTYLEDFSNNKDNSSCSSFYSPSMVSDAASPVAWNTMPGEVFGQSSHMVCQTKVPKKLSYKKKKPREIPDDDDSLEDTASSPVNSPKVAHLKPVDRNSRKSEDHCYSSLLGKESALEGTMLDGRKECMDLKGKGLCLIPISNLVNYFG